MDDNNLPQKDLIKKIVGDARGAVGIRLCAIGVDLGIFEDLAKNGPATSQELADRMNLDERYLREWGLGMFSLGYLDFDKVSRKISLNKEFIPVLVEEGGKFSQKIQVRGCTPANFVLSNRSMPCRSWFFTSLVNSPIVSPKASPLAGFPSAPRVFPPPPVKPRWVFL